MIHKLALIFFGAALLCLVIDFASSRKAVKTPIVRSDYNGMSKTEDFLVKIGKSSERLPFSVSVSAREYDDTEIKEVFHECVQILDESICGENESVDYITKDMKLPENIEGYPIRINWTLDRYDLMDGSGKIKTENIDENGELINLQGFMHYENDKEQQAVYNVTVRVYPKKEGGLSGKLSKLKKAVAQADENEKTTKELVLPSKLDGESVNYYRPFDTRGFAMIGMAAVLFMIPFLLSKEKVKEKDKKKREQMRMDYPEIVSKFTLLTGAGLTAKNAWRRIVSDYEANKKRTGLRYAYEEMRTTCNEMLSGVPEIRSYENFGQRCEEPLYLKFGALLSQNLRKGTKGMGILLKAEAVTAFEERKANAKRKGEEAGTKLLAPMFLMLSVVLIMVIVPAFMSM